MKAFRKQQSVQVPTANPIAAMTETLVRFVRPDRREQFAEAWPEVLKSRRMVIDPAAAIRVIVEPLIRRECRTEFAALLRKIKAAGTH